MAKKKAKRPRGRQRRLQTKRDRERFLKALRQVGGFKKAACRRFGISFPTLLAEEERDLEFARQVREIKDECLEDLEATGYERAMAGSDTLLKFFLQTGLPEKYGRRIEHQGTVVNLHAHEHRVTIVEDESWYGNTAHDKASQALEAPVADSDLPSPVQGGSLRPALGQNGHGSNGHH